MDQNQESTSTPSSAFKHKQTKSCSLKKADKAPPTSPHKLNEIFKNLDKKYDIRIQTSRTKTQGKETYIPKRRRRAMDCTHLPRPIYDSAKEILEFP